MQDVIIRVMSKFLPAYYKPNHMLDEEKDQFPGFAFFGFVSRTCFLYGFTRQVKSRKPSRPTREKEHTKPYSVKETRPLQNKEMHPNT